MFTFNKKETKRLAKDSNLVKNNVLRNAILKLDSEIVVGGTNYSQVVYDRIVHDRHVSSLT